MNDPGKMITESLRQFASCNHDSLRCEKCGSRASVFGWMAFSDYDETRTNLAAAEALLREACIGYENGAVDCSGDKRLRLIPIFHTWYERAKEFLACGTTS